MGTVAMVFTEGCQIGNFNYFYQQMSVQLLWNVTELHQQSINVLNSCHKHVEWRKLNPALCFTSNH